MRIIEVKENKKQYLDLLLLADEQENMLDRYLYRGTMYALHHGGTKALWHRRPRGRGTVRRWWISSSVPIGGGMIAYRWVPGIAL